ncbi:MAG TPA: FAD-dependent oxidoreductase [Pyrinomonadaceae bacterium]|jgi:2-polyprenyl-6-methoxyphenol hydroxylase-like FAD-dependent oxidoreductase|nr:FAD-dependent oxidoreductase [Pyrinomonadaceae bacterium]
MSQETSSQSSHIQTRCCIAGGGPAGMMLGFLLARAGVEVVLLEKHKDFLRDFRGDTIHPSTLELMHELGLLDEFLKRPHQELKQLAGQIGGDRIPLADFSHLSTKCKFLAFMPQWDFLDFLAMHGKQYPTFHLLMETEVTDLIEEGASVVGVKAMAAGSQLEIRASLTVGADGRHSIVRERARLTVEVLGAPIDVLWFRINRNSSDPGQVLGRFSRGKIMVMLDRGDYWQCGFVIAKGTFEALQQRGFGLFHQDILDIAPFLKDRVSELRDWKEIKLLTVAVDRLLTWYRPGLLCIGDASHAMSPVGGVGINLAIQDAVATANLLAAKLSKGSVTTSDLQRVQKRRLLPTRLTQRAQVFIQERVLGRALGQAQQTSAPWFLRIFKSLPILQRIPAYLVGIGVRPEHIRTADVFKR